MMDVERGQNIYLKKVGIFFLFLFCFFVSAQEEKTIEMDTLLDHSFDYHKKYNDLKELEYAKKAALLAEEAGDSKRKAESYFRISCALSSLELHRESFSFIQKANAEKYTRNNIFFQAQLKDIKANNYLNLNLISPYKKEIHEIIELLKDRKDILSLKLLQRAYVNIASNHPEEKKDSSFYYYGKASEILKKIPEKTIYKDLCHLYLFKGSKFLQKKQNDSALIYFKKSVELRNKYRDRLLVFEYIKLGDYYFSISDHQKALSFYLKAIKNMEEFSVNEMLFTDVYKKTADLYEILGNKSAQSEYEKIYAQIQTKIKTERTKNVDFASNIILKDKQDEYTFSNEKNLLWVIFGGIALLVLFSIVYRILHKNIQLKESLITEAENILEQKNTLISQKSMEKEALQQKIGNAYKEVMELAQANDPSFYFRFQEVYPEFQEQLLEYSPRLKNTELILCAYIFLGFPIKDIAEYTFKSVNTIRNRKQNLRKKFSISTELDMEIWLKKLIYPDQI